MDNLELLKTEFIKRYRDDLINWDSDIAKFEGFDEFVEKYIFIPPKILLVGEEGVGKTSIMNLFPGDIIIELDNDMNESVQKTIFIQNNNRIISCILKEINIQDIIDKPNVYRQILDSATLICLVTNSGASNLTRTKRLFSQLKPLVKKAVFYVIANFQDLKLASFEPARIEHFFALKTYSFSAASNNAKEEVISMFKEMLNISRLMM
jgi:GTPase SAR1 family protein